MSLEILATHSSSVFVAPVDHTNEKVEAVPSSTSPHNWSPHFSNVRTVKVSNISLTTSTMDIGEFFSFSGEIQYIEMQRENDHTQVAYVTFKETQGAETAVLLTGSKIGDLYVTITPVENYQLPPEALASTVTDQTPTTVMKAEDVMSTMLAKGFILGKDAITKAKAFDERHNLSSNASSTVASIDRKIGLSDKLSIGTAIVNEKMRDLDERYRVSEKTKSAYAVAEQKASVAGSAIMSNHYVLTGASWFSSAFSAIAKAAEDVSTKTKEKVEQAEVQKKEAIINERKGTVDEFAKMHLESDAGPAIVPVNSGDDSKHRVL
ncbi:binding partner of ACD11 1 isoform X1 [Arachis ipaensis]|uniref:binding partner of ACD11 1 isoform X1 n=1 Tax=Arachis ipaensis TaxID=130454 RepID=UPI000A2B3B24|nr:binding partner of ACD11 1 isoform X1 [Arachis ipaensis]XP_025684042.1 binding partner of ACD11 1 isoform X1 [Arachis hypogaea]QHO04714.1 Binding partner of ACD11 [Arachis hypogaea]